MLTPRLWDQASLLFEDQELPDAPAENLTLRCSTAELILELVRRIPSRETVRRGLGSLDRPLAATPDPPARLDDLALGPADGHLLSRIDGAISARTIIETAPLPVEEVERSLLGLLFTGVVQYMPAAGAPARA